MKIEFHIKDVVLTASQKSLIEKKLQKLKRYVKDETLIMDVYLTDETSAEKGGVDQSVELSATFSNEKFFVREVDSRLLRAFAFAYKKLDRNLYDFHEKKLDRTQKGDNHFDRFLKAIRVKKSYDEEL